MSFPSYIIGGPLRAAQDRVSLEMPGHGTAVVQLTGTFSATVTFEGSIDGFTFFAINAVPTNGSTAVTTATSTGVWAVSAAGLSVVSARCSAYTSGAVNAMIRSAPGGGSGSGGGGGGGGTVNQGDAGSSAWPVYLDPTADTPAAPTFATVGVTSAPALAASATRKKVELQNTSSNFISYAYGANAAVLYSGITLAPYGYALIDNPAVAALAINAIASGASSNLGIQAYT